MLDFRRRRLPHITSSTATYFVTWRQARGLPELQPDERTAVADALRFFDGKRYWLLAWVVMNDHVHVLFDAHPDHALSAVLHSWKSFTANRLQREFGRRGAVWQHEYFDRMMRDDADVAARASYIARNPFKRWPDLSSYEWMHIDGRLDGADRTSD